jgi:beta-1,4-mannosyl-glycoprotein beta-1,4-N-acetylglucosaminyltransferase
MKLYDCFVFHNEFDILEIRLRELADVVDHFVLVEANETQTGLAKPYFFEENKQRFSEWSDKIIHVKVEFPKTLPPAEGGYRRKEGWEREHYQRNCIMKGLAECEPEDLVLLSDVDEIVRADLLKDLLASKAYKGKLLVFAQTLFKYKLNRYQPDYEWLLGSRLIERKYIPTVQALRLTKAKLRERGYIPAPVAKLILRFRNYLSCRIGLPIEIIHDAGWHFSSMGGLEAFRVKLASTVEGVLFNQDDLDAEYERLVSQYDLYPLERLPKAVAEGDFSHLLDPAPVAEKA